MDTPYIFLNLQVGQKVVKGEATERFFEGQIAIDEVGWELACDHQPVQDQKGVRKDPTLIQPKRLTLQKAFDRSTVNLCDYMAKRLLFDTATITMVKSLAWEEKPRPHIEITLTKGYVESVNLVASEGNLSVAIKEKVTLSFSAIKILYYSNVASSLSTGAPATTFQLEMPSEIQ